MPTPFNYATGGMNPVDAMFGGMEFGQQQRQGEQDILAGRQAMDLNASQEARTQTQFGQQNVLFDQGQQDRQTMMADQAAARANAQKMQDDLLGLSEKVMAGKATSNDFAAMATLYPDLTDEMEKMWEGQATERKDADVANIFKAATAIKAGKPQIAIDMLEERATAADASGDKQEADIARAMAETIKIDPNAGLTTLGMLLQAVDGKASVELFGVAEAELPADIRSLQFRADAAGLVKGTQEYKDFMQSGGGNEGDAPASFRALEMQAEAAGLVKGSAEYKEFMATKGSGLVAEASAEGKARGENTTLLASMESKMPGLEVVVSELDGLADAATYTKIGRANDATRKELGLEPRPAAIAAAEYLAIVDNQVLPLLRDTFGAAFTQKEGDTLRATLGDPAKSPAEKKAVLRAFIAQKKRDVIALQAQIDATKAGGSGSPAQSDQAFDPAEIDSLMNGP